MARLIDADALDWERIEHEHGARHEAVVDCEQMVEKAPTIDAVPVVRCKDCKHFADDYVDTGFGPIPAFSCDVCELYGVGLSLNHYCSCGERKDDE